MIFCFPEQGQIWNNYVVDVLIILLKTQGKELSWWDGSIRNEIFEITWYCMHDFVFSWARSSLKQLCSWYIDNSAQDARKRVVLMRWIKQKRNFLNHFNCSRRISYQREFVYFYLQPFRVALNSIEQNFERAKLVLDTSHCRIVDNIISTWPFNVHEHGWILIKKTCSRNSVGSCTITIKRIK